MDWAKDLMTPTRTKDLQRFYGIKYEELWDEDRLVALGVTDDEIKEIASVRGKELAYKDTVGFELGEGVIESERFKNLKECYGVTLEDTQDESKLKAKGLSDEDIFYITGKRIASKKKINGSKKSSWGGSTEKQSKTTK